MPRILERGQIEASAGHDLPRLRLPEPRELFAARAARLRELAADGAIGHSIADYLHLMASLADAQHHVLADVEPGGVLAELEPEGAPADAALSRAREHGMPVLRAAAQHGHEWRSVLARLCTALERDAALPVGVRRVLERLRDAPADALERQADALLAGRPADVDVAAAPFTMAALQVRVAAFASRVPGDAAEALASRVTHNASEARARRVPHNAAENADVPGVCPVCGMLPVASVVREGDSANGRRFLHCALCATEWHLVRVTCSNCRSTQGISYRSIEGGPDAIRAECCDGCRTYRKILYQEKDARVEPVADDLASLALDLLLAEAGYHRASANPLLWTGA